MHVDEPGIGSMSVTPDLVQQHLPGEHLPWPTGETCEEIEFEWRQRNHLIAATDHMSSDIDLEIADGEVFDERLRGRTKSSTQSRDEFLRLERLVDVIVGTVFESCNDVKRVRARGEHDDRHARLRTNTATHLDAITTGQHHIEEHDVGLAIAENCQCKITVSTEHRFKSFGAQHDSQHLGKSCVIINDENSTGHGHILSPRPRPRHAGGPMSDAPVPVRLGELFVRTYQFMRAHLGATVGIGALLATLDATVSGIATTAAGDAARSLGEVLSTQQNQNVVIGADTLDQVMAALPWIGLTLLISVLTQFAATGVMTLAVVRERRSEPVQPATLWRGVPWAAFLGVNAAIFGAIVGVLIPFAIVSYVVAGVMPWLLVVTGMGAVAACIAIAIMTSLAVPALINETLGVTAALRRSTQLVRKRWLRVGWLLVVASLLWSVIGTIISSPISALLGLLAGGSGSAFGQALQAITANIVTGAIALPGIAVTTTLIYFARTQDQ